MNQAAASQTARLQLDDESLDLPIAVGTENDHAVDVTHVRGQSGYITLDEGYRNTGSCASQITFINPEAGVLRYRGYPIEQLAEQCTFVETALLLIRGELPTRRELDDFNQAVADNAHVDSRLLNILEGFPRDANAMAMLSACISGLCGHHPEVLEENYTTHFDLTAAKLIGKVKTVAASIHRHMRGESESVEPDAGRSYTADFLHMFTGRDVDEEIARELDLIFLLHGDHEQNCSAATVRMVGSSHANLFASCAAGVCALWGPLHGGANVAIMNQLQEIHDSDEDANQFIAGVKDKKYRLFGFGHPVYKNYDPRARILKASADKVLDRLGIDDPLLDLAKQLERTALADDYFVDRKLYPNVDFYSGIIMRALGVPTEMFTVMFAIGRMAGWIAQWKEVRDSDSRIYRPRQLYVGSAQRNVTPIAERG